MDTPKWSRGAQCAWCKRPLRDDHPPYIITKDSRIFGPYHVHCVDPATLKIDPDAWRARRAYAARRPLGGEREK